MQEGKVNREQKKVESTKHSWSSWDKRPIQAKLSFPQTKEGLNTQTAILIDARHVYWEKI